MGFSAFVVNLTGTDMHKERNCGLAQSYTVYVMRVMNGSQSWVAEKRYSDFACLDEVLRSKFWYMSVPKLPAKKLFFNFDDDFVERRRKELETYIHAILQVACFSQSDELWQFLTDQRHIVGVPTELREENERLAAALPVEP
mmetsp:Transcript_38258/g.95792  ORF Transcript_38258/g.95792 Transcript_38258/m.95792 type:complete len:142 (+) Transcript_38258:123-548(+)|eukprot:CAMPEP_0173436146 /NCGR_PEP_ID=MMETSP1357-20121228/15786_1 /TAXON_ID=77926 /ORGANISM="Hemiselmis rufescens, Strain PCC563" /LENGTH=141 /DNA_ID=CAMNT_0014401205 /DNA_START=117 /DNA_END=542 /DNA_ORIENTATION=+